MRCPDCQKFVSLEFQEPECNDLEVSVEVEEGAAIFTVTGTVRLVRNCGECGECGRELKEATLDVEQTAEFGENVAVSQADYDADKLKAMLEDLEVGHDIEQVEEGGGRYAESYFGAHLNLTIKAGGVVVASVDWSDKVAASAMDELV